VKDQDSHAVVLNNSMTIQVYGPAKTVHLEHTLQTMEFLVHQFQHVVVSTHTQEMLQYAMLAKHVQMDGP
jgi:hypothetical protein